MFFFRKKELRKKCFYEESDQIFLYRGAFYWPAIEKDDTSHIFTVIPGDDIPYKEFRDLAVDCVKKMLLECPVVLNNLYCYPLEPVGGTLAEDDCVKQYIAQGGTPVFAAKNELYTVSKGIDRQLVECVPKEVYGYYGLLFYGYKHIKDTPFHRDLTIHYHEDHQYLEISVLDDVSKYIDIVLEICKKHGKQVLSPKE